MMTQDQLHGTRDGRMAVAIGNDSTDLGIVGYASTFRAARRLATIAASALPQGAYKMTLLERCPTDCPSDAPDADSWMLHIVHSETRHN